MSATPQPQLDAELAPFTLISAESGIAVALDELIATGPAVLAWIGNADHDDPRREMLHDLGGQIASSTARLVVVSGPESPIGRQLANGGSAQWLTDASGDASRALGLTDQRRMRRNRLREGLFVATGHGSEGVILGAGSAEQVAALVLGAEPPFEPAPFDPLRS